MTSEPHEQVMSFLRGIGVGKDPLTASADEEDGGDEQAAEEEVRPPLGTAFSFVFFFCLSSSFPSFSSFPGNASGIREWVAPL